MHRFKSSKPLRRTDTQDSEWEEVGRYEAAEKLIGGGELEAAEKHIKEIRAGYGLESNNLPPSIVESLKQACKVSVILSECGRTFKADLGLG